MELLKLYDLKLLRKVNKMKGNSRKNWESKRDLLESHVAKVLPTLNKKKLPKADLKGHELTFFTYWNKFITGKSLKEHEFNQIVNELASNLASAAIFMRAKTTALEAAQMHFKIRGENCRKSGKSISCSLNDKLQFEFRQWNRKTIKLDNGEDYPSGDFGPLVKNSFADKVEERIIDCPSGRLLINDWFRCNKNEFTEAVKAEKEDYSEENSINYPRGRVIEINRHADLGFMKVNMTDAPSVYLEGDKIIFGKDTSFDWEEMENEKKHNKNYKGSVCLDLWAASCIDEEVFLNILMTKTKGMTKSKAEAHLKKVKKIWTSISLKVKPGKYKLSFCGDFKTFDAKIRKKGCKVPKKYKMYCLLEKVK